MASSTDQPLESHLAAFGLQAFRPGQRQVIEALLRGHDCLCVMPTGGGKSLCFQLPSIARAGVTLVISPLISLMKNHVDALLVRGIRATLINSTLTIGQQQSRLKQMAAGRFDLVYIAPERLRSLPFLAAVKRTQIQLLAVDEAHCISQWGHDFRPEYLQLGELRGHLGMPQTIALTATATPAVRKDIVQQLTLQAPEVFITGFARPNLRFEAQIIPDPEDKDRTLVELLGRMEGAGIVYAATRKACEELYALLNNTLQRPVGVYHAGLPLDQRREVQDAFMRNALPIMVATNAFGMGIDKPDLRFVIHYNVPGSPESYYQEAGRAGRDGQPARCILLFSPMDCEIQEYFVENAYPSRETVAAVYDYLRSQEESPIEITQHDLRDRLRGIIGSEGVGAAQRLLEQCGAIERLVTRENMAAIRLDYPEESRVDRLPRSAHVQRQVLQAVERLVGTARGERVYFSIRQLSGVAGRPRASVLRGLRELAQLPWFDYVPPFRGRAIHVRDRSRSFRDFPIDFEKLARLKAHELMKLDRMVRYATTDRCRQWEILDYFGDPQARPCQHCDNCGGPAATPPDLPQEPSHQDPIWQSVRIALSGAARARGCGGVSAVAEMLCGARTRVVRERHLDRLSTYGLLRHLQRAEAIQFLEALVQVRLLQVVPPDRGLALTPRGRELMRGTASLEAPLPVDANLARKLQATPIPPAASSPPAPAPASAGSAEPTPAEPADRIELPAARAFYWTWRVLQAGFPVEQCCHVRQLEEHTVLDHIAQALAAGLPVSAGWVLSEEQQLQLAAPPSETGPTAPSAPLDPRRVELYQQIQAAHEHSNGQNH